MPYKCFNLQVDSMLPSHTHTHTQIKHQHKRNLKLDKKGVFGKIMNDAFWLRAPPYPAHGTGFGRWCVLLHLLGLLTITTVTSGRYIRRIWMAGLVMSGKESLRKLPLINYAEAVQLYTAVIYVNQLTWKISILVLSISGGLGKLNFDAGIQ